jgi:hypothetical protein
VKVVRGKDGRVEYSKYAGCLVMLKLLAIVVGVAVLADIIFQKLR